jgi:hypothetical protein
MRRLRLLLRLVGLTLAATVYVWFAAVRNAAAVKRRKAARRARRRLPG